MMKEEQIERRLKIELDFLKVYAVFIIGLVTGNVNLLLSYFREEEKITLVLFLVGFIALLIFIVLAVRTIKHLYKLSSL